MGKFKFKKSRAMSKGNTKRPDNIAYLPDELVTTDIDDPNKVHTIDPPHIIKSAAKKHFFEQELGGIPDWKQTTKRGKVDKPKKGNFRLKDNMHEVHMDRLRTYQHAIAFNLDAMKNGEPIDDRVRYIWFPLDDIRKSQLFYGNPPPDSQRPKHLRGINLVVDPMAPAPVEATDFMKATGKTARQLYEDYINKNIDSGAFKTSRIIQPEAKKIIV